MSGGGKAADAAVGFIGGLMGGLAGLSGLAPAIWTQLRGWPKDVARGVYQPFILLAHIVTLLLIGVVALDRVGVVLFLAAAPAIALGGWVGWMIYGKLDERRFQQMFAACWSCRGIAVGPHLRGEPCRVVELYLAYVLACVVITMIPGPTVTLIVANSLAHGTRAGLLNVAGTQLGLGLMMLVLIVGLSSIIATMGMWFDWLRFDRRRLSDLAGLEAVALLGLARRHASRATATRRLRLAGLPCAARQSEGAALVRRLHPAVRRSRDRLCLAGRPARSHRHGDRGDFRRRLCGAGGSRTRRAVAQPRAADFAPRRGLPDRRRRLARAYARAR